MVVQFVIATGITEMLHTYRNATHIKYIEYCRYILDTVSMPCRWRGEGKSKCFQYFHSTSTHHSGQCYKREIWNTGRRALLLHRDFAFAFAGFMLTTVDLTFQVACVERTIFIGFFVTENFEASRYGDTVRDLAIFSNNLACWELLEPDFRSLVAVLSRAHVRVILEECGVDVRNY